jgi:hypothetical protein
VQLACLRTFIPLLAPNSRAIITRRVSNRTTMPEAYPERLSAKREARSEKREAIQQVGGVGVAGSVAKMLLEPPTHADGNDRYPPDHRHIAQFTQPQFRQDLSQSKSRTVPTIIHHISIHLTRASSSVQVACSTSCITSLTDDEVSQGCKYQHGCPVVGWSPCERRGNDALGRLRANEVCSVVSNGEDLNSDVSTISFKGSGDPSTE